MKGAFTGAVANKIGRFQLADGARCSWTKWANSIPNLQTKLLRVLQEGEFERIGSSETCKVDVRIVAATNRNLRHGDGDKPLPPGSLLSFGCVSD